MQHKLPVKHLIRQSGRISILLVLASLIVGTTNEFSVLAILSRALVTLSLLSFAFFANIAALIFYDNRRKSATEKIGRKTFITGYILTLLIIIAYRFLDEYFRSKGYQIFPQDKNLMDRSEGWRLYVMLPYVSLIIYAFIFLIQNFVVHQYEKSRIELELLQLKSVNTETANQLLRQQIQPHFLFNALNVLKSLIKKYPQTAEAYLMRLSDFLRASITRNTSGLATVKEELKLCADYMEMQQIRFGEALQYKVMLDADDEYLNKTLPFFALQPLLENAIKHNELTTAHPLSIMINRKDNFIVVSNNLQPKKTAEHSTGNGLANLRERYKLLSNDDIIIANNNQEFVVSIKILEHEHRNN